MHTGGRIYGEGMKGFVQDSVCLKDDIHTFCEYITLNKNTIRTIYVHSLDDKKKITLDELQEVLNDHEMKNIVSKTFKGKMAADAFRNELAAMKVVLKILPDSKYSTIVSAFIYKNIPVYGISILYKKHSRSYHTLTEKCSTQIEDIKFTQQMFDRFVNDIKDSLDKIHSQGFYHNDVKPDNMIYCPQSKRYKLIDWELAGRLTEKPPHFTKCGTSLYNHPLKFYIGGLPAFIARELMNYSMFLGKHLWVKKLKSFARLRELTKKSFDFILATNDLSIEQLYKKYAPHYDNYAFALSIMYLAERNKLKPPADIVKESMQPLLPTPL